MTTLGGVWTGSAVVLFNPNVAPPTGGDVLGAMGDGTINVSVALAINGVGVYSGAGSPNGSLTAAKGSIYLNTSGSGINDRVWVNTNSGTVWTYLVTGA